MNEYVTKEDLDYLGAIVRREVAKELRRIALAHNDIANSPRADVVKATVHMEFCLEMQARAEEIENGGPS